MASYRVYFLDSHTKHFTGVIEFHADDDQAAISRAEATPAWLDRELWSQERRVLVLNRTDVTALASMAMKHAGTPLRLVTSCGGDERNPIGLTEASRPPPPPQRPRINAPGLAASAASHPAVNEHRAVPRRTLMLMLGRLTTSGGTSLCRIRNVSAAGFGIETTARLSPGERVSIASLQENFDCQVAWSKDMFAGLRTARAVMADDLVNLYSISPQRPRWEHEYLKTLCAELLASVTPAEPPAENRLHKVRQRFSHALRANLKYMQWSVYPRLLRQSDPPRSATVARLKVAAQSLEGQFGDYTRRWITNPIGAAWPDYARDTRALVAALTAQLREEELHLFRHLA